MKVRKGAMAALPASVERLRILNTRLPQSCFQSDPVQQAIISPSRLTELDFSGSNSTELEVRQATTTWPHVTTLKLNECRLGPIVELVPNLDRLEVLEAKDASICTWDLGVISRHVGGTLRRLSIARSEMTVGGASVIGDKLINLESLDISGSRQLSPVAFFIFANLRPTLRFLDISDTNVDGGTSMCSDCACQPATSSTS